MEKLTPKERATRIFYLLHGREPKKGETLSLADSMDFALLSSKLSNWAIEQGFTKKV